MMNKLPKYIDWGFCLVMIPLMTLVFPVGRWVSDMPSYALLLIAIFFLSYFGNRKVSVPLLLRDGRGIVLGLLIVLGFTAVIVVLTYYHEGWPFYRLAETYTHVDMGKVEMSQQRVWLAFIVVQLFSITVGLLDELSQQRMRQQRVQHERELAALAFYRAQLSPHFLYNTLNSLYGLIVTHSDQAESAFMKFIELNRVITANIHKDSISVALSHQFLRNFIDLQRLRMDAQTTVALDYDSDDPTARIAPMLLFTFVENALKHGVTVGHACHIAISLKVSDGVLTFSTENPASQNRTSAGCGTGLANCRRRLELLYPHRHQLDITHTDELFRVLLTINLNDPV